MSDPGWLGVLRPRFLLLAMSSVVLAIALCWPAVIDPGFVLDAALLALGALAAHAAVNVLNEYHDFRSGLDLHTERTAFSGGSGALPAHPHRAGAALCLGLGCLALCVAIGGWFLLRKPELAWRLAPLGAAGVLLVLLYTPWLTRRPWLCLMAPGLGFGPLMVLGGVLVLGGSLDGRGLLVSLVPFFLCNNLLLLNQFPDVQADRLAGRCTLPMLIGPQRAVRVLCLQWALAFGLLPLAVLLGLLPGATLVALFTLPLALRAAWLLREPCSRGPLLAAMRLNVLVSLLTPLLLAAGVVAG